MLFNSTEFLFVFLPLLLIVFFQLARISQHLAASWLALGSLFFYAWWTPPTWPCCWDAVQRCSNVIALT